MNYVFYYNPVIFVYSACFFLIEGEFISADDLFYLLESESNALFKPSGTLPAKL
jgi:hypothetical protein